MSRFPALVCGLAALAACTAASGPDREDAPAEPAASLAGRWHIVEVNSSPPLARPGGEGTPPAIAFTRDGYGGNSGCNSFGGIGLEVGNRWFAEPPMATMIGCGALNAQESLIYRVVAGGPAIEWRGADLVVLRAGGETLRLRRAGTVPAAQARPTMLLAGTRWALSTLDGRALVLAGAAAPLRLGFEADEWRLEAGCESRTGRWRQGEGSVRLHPATGASTRCGRAGDALARTLAGRLDYRVGPNGELVIASADHWIVGRRERDREDGQAQWLAGRWRIAAVDGAPTPASARPPELVFNAGAFFLWDGCRHSEGVAIALARKLFTRESGVATLAACPADPLQTKIAAILADAPRIARTAGTGVALVSAKGELRLSRLGATIAGAGARLGPRAGESFDLPTESGSSARLDLGPRGRFAVALDCGSFSGSWRGSGAGGAARFSPDALPKACERDADARSLAEMFTGDVHAAIGPKRDIALFANGERGWPATAAKRR
jgi:heat shock protein HslJ